MIKTTLVYPLDRSTNRVLLGQIKKKNHVLWRRNGFWWKMEEWETIWQCAVRELYEESGISIWESELQLVGKMHFIFWADEPNRYCEVYICPYNWDIHTETDEMIPKRRDISWLPYDHMRDGDDEWLEVMLQWDIYTEKTLYADENWKYIWIRDGLHDI